MKRLYMLLAVVFIMVIAGCGSSGTDAVSGGSDYTSAYIGTLKYVPGGTFQRDATATNTSTVSAFRMSRYEITAEQFTAVTGLANPSSSFTGVDNGPVQLVNWYHALAFCNILSMREGLTPVYWISLSTDPADWVIPTGGVVPTTNNDNWNAAAADWNANGYRLPTEMEWMWAAMGATGGTTGYLKAFAGSTGSNLIADYVWYTTNSSASTHTEGGKLPNELGIYDMSGNVFEWCWDWYDDPYPTGALTNYRGAAPSTFRVVRGGSWNTTNVYTTVAHRHSQSPNSTWDDFGFRVVRH